MELPAASPALQPTRWRAALDGAVTIGRRTGAPALVLLALVLELAIHPSGWSMAAATLCQLWAAVVLLSLERRAKFGVVAHGASLRHVAPRIAASLVLGLFLAARVQVVASWFAGAVELDTASRVLPTYGAILLGAAAALGALQRPSASELLEGLHLRPLQTVVVSFGFAILAGTLLLTLPVSVVSAADVSLADALFMATSAVCVTGLAVIDLSTRYTAFGQLVVLLLIQAGGLGMMLLYAALASVAGRRLTARHEAELVDAAGVDTAGHLRATVRFILLSTFALEAIGVVLLLEPLSRVEGVHPVWAAVFHAVSAFCNAGFSNVPGGLAPLRDSPALLLTLSALIVAGGLGYPVLCALLPRRWHGMTHRPLHVRLVLVTSGVLIVTGFTGLLLLDGTGSLRDLDFGARLLNGLFLSVSARTAGFSAVDLAAATPAGASVIMALMLVGASPGSTGGGFKTTTLAVLALTLLAVLRRRTDVRVAFRTIPTEDVLRAFALTIATGALLGGGLLVLLTVDPLPPFTLLFEAISAITTTGLSLGATERLSPAGRLVIVALMFVGRLGPLTLLAAFLERREDGRVRYPRERILFG